MRYELADHKWAARVAAEMVPGIRAVNDNRRGRYWAKRLEGQLRRLVFMQRRLNPRLRSEDFNYTINLEDSLARDSRRGVFQATKRLPAHDGLLR